MPLRVTLPRWTRPATRPDAALLAALVALVGGVLVELLPVGGGDLVAQRWWQSWAASAGGHPVDLAWYAGSPAVSYSLLAPWVLALVGPAVAGVVSSTTGAWATTRLLVRGGAARPTAVAVVSALAFLADQLSGRTTFAMGAAAGLLALVAVQHRLGRPTRCRVLAAGSLAAVAGALSPVAAVLLGLAAVAWWAVAARRSRSGWTAVAVLLAGAGVPLLVMVALGASGGPMTGSAHQMLAAVLAALVVLAVVGRRLPVVRAGAALTVLALLAAWLVPDPMGSNTTRLVLLFAVPVLVAVPGRSTVLVALAAVLVTWLLPPLVPQDLVPRDTGPVERAAAPLLAELGRRGPVGRVEVVPLADHSDAAMGAQVPLARGWTRQLDLARNPLFYDGGLDAGSYLAWLRARGVSYVALSTQRPDWAGREEAALVRGGVPGLDRVWSDGTWSLYAVDGPGLVLDGDAQVVASGRTDLVLSVGGGDVLLSMFWDDRLTLVGDGCLEPGPAEGTVRLRAPSAGTVTVTSGWRTSGRC
ncbi:hypothetical protein [Klenkia taihuensis]|uniref:4-amino-4-deoxy-L-arabinose transferase n=1 Tax=Klenkia taihuensis TaxID=1225127 RepID=A0A1I1SBB7_9ACTN|nr:hypothetical protein [Klenkia taihuensis]GHE13553.1 MFS transporter [Klenkia taihuensis]SFD43781.1 hypothetical protein SAMN05661030_3339 [Klenkia taihuensis]